MTYRQTILRTATLLLAGHLTSHPPFSGLAFVVLPLLVWLQRRDCEGFPWYALIFFLGVGVTIPFAVVDVGSGVGLATTIWVGYAVVAALLTRPPRFAKSPIEIAAWTYLPLSLPFIGFVFVAPPLSAAGWWYPATGLAGVFLMVWLGGSVVAAVQSAAVRPILLPLALSIICNYVAIMKATRLDASVASVSQQVPAPPHNEAQSVLAAVRERPAVQHAFEQGAQIAVLPENVLGSPGVLSAAILDIPDGRTVVAGGVRQDPKSGQWAKGTWVLPDGVFYPAIQPIPVIESGLSPHWGALGRRATIAGRAYSLLICYEASTTLPLYHLHTGGPILLLGNGWWDRSGIMDIESGLAQSWARLFHAPIEIARGFPLGQKRALFD